ncbi:hypothetical protein OEZ85_000436 [Tetradesmus obliquus]|uniref:Uncharacterized protein n=1 Tax=Tetradesmus obliquus TaxID=3088 RepID=A0ABY8UI50_TETOB|nr:hypothetical protein OEZ85_000436 [Tetradesmus obliquus]
MQDGAVLRERHQRDDWPQHKPECKAFRALGLRATFYRDEDMLAAFPLQSHRAARSSTPPPVPAGASCPICGKGAGQAPLTRTPCCQQLVCDTNARYQIGSFSRDICPGSHQRYTLCGNHGVEDKCDKSKDWRQCKGCVKVSDPSDAPDMLWRGLNAYNRCPLLAKDVPRHSLCEACASCGRRFLGGVEGYSRGTAGSLHCADCSDSGRGGVFRVTGSRLGAAMPAAGVQAQAAAFAAGEARARSPFL